LGPVNFPVVEGFPGPPCGTQCTTDTGGTGDPFADAGNYPCPPTAAQQAAGVTCGIIYGNLAGDGVTTPISFNTAVATTPPPPPTGTIVTTTVPVATVAPKSKSGGATKTGSSSLAFTGTGPGLWWLALVGALFMVLGVFALVLVDQPRRLVRLATNRVGRSKERDL
jgi:hypothetical protein